MKIEARYFLNLKPDEQVKYLEEGAFTGLSRNEKIEFLKSVLREDPPFITTACALRKLCEMRYPDGYFFRKYLCHRDKSVVKAAKKAIDECRKSIGDDTSPLLEMLREGESDDCILLVNFFLEQEGKLNENALISFLRLGDSKVREIIVKRVTQEHQVDDAELSKAICKGVAWYVRAALVEILGNRKSEHLFDNIEFLVNDRNVEVKLKLVAALSKLKMEKGKAYLQKLLDDTAVWVRKEAHRALKAF